MEKAAENVEKFFRNTNIRSILKKISEEITDSIVKFFFLRSISHQLLIEIPFLITPDTKLVISDSDLEQILRYYLQIHQKNLYLHYPIQEKTRKKIAIEINKVRQATNRVLRYQELPIKVEGKKDWRQNDREWRASLDQRMRSGSINTDEYPIYPQYPVAQQITDAIHENPFMVQRLENLCQEVFGTDWSWSNAAFPSLINDQPAINWLKTVKAMSYSVLCNQNFWRKNDQSGQMELRFSNRALYEKGWSKHEIYQKSWYFQKNIQIDNASFQRLWTTNISDRSRIDFLLFHLYKKGESFNNIQYTKPREAYSRSFNFGFAPPPLSMAPLGWCAIIDSYNGFESLPQVRKWTELEKAIKLNYKLKMRYWKAVKENSNRIDLSKPMELWK